MGGRKLKPLAVQLFAKKGDNKTRHAPSLPNALILGDSISIGYTPMVISQLKGKVKVVRAKANCGDSNRYLRSLPKWLGDTKWDVIHFNMGLHDLCYRHPDSKVQGNRDKVKGTIAVPLAQYEKNLEEIVTRLKATGARLIWASTTVVPEEEAGRHVGDEIKYNTAVRKIMEKHDIRINDLHALSAKFPPKLFKKPGDVHFKPEGSLKLASQVASSIRAALKTPSARKTE
ncbi:MAG: SGNH/GDSL hydrolase family protein [Phycisphaerae bacterium]|nr:SGNH/GDSL hydrolase family protein [Phycisphaerae bacterium]